MEALLVEALARAPLEAQVERALEQKEREHGLGFGVLWLGPRFLDLRREVKTARRIPLQDVREVALELSEHQALLRVEAASRHLEVPLAEVSNPHVLATLLARQGSRGSTARVALTVKHPPPTDATAARPAKAVRRWRFSGVPPYAFVLIPGGLFFLVYGIDVTLAARDSLAWRSVPAVITSARTWETQRTGQKNQKQKVEHGAIRYQFVLDGVTHEGTRFNVDGTEAIHARRYSTGQQVIAYVPADKPWNAVLSQDTPGFSRLFILIGVSILGFALWSILGGFKG
nr:DUF3592 domain-containing protein [Pyxidicoccus fallax]